MDDSVDIRRQLGAYIAHLMDGWNQSVGAAHIGIRQSELSELMRGKLQRFSVERLLRILLRLDYDVELHVKPNQAPRPRRAAAKTSVRVWDRVNKPVEVTAPRPGRRPRVPMD